MRLWPRKKRKARSDEEADSEGDDESERQGSAKKRVTAGPDDEMVWRCEKVFGDNGLDVDLLSRSVKCFLVS
jgi:hypothetical protein